MSRSRTSVTGARLRQVAAGGLATLVAALGAAPGHAAARTAARTTCSAADWIGNPLLGPRLLPDAGPLGRMLEGYRRTAGMSPRGYLRRFYEPNRGWRYPGQGGYQITPWGQPVKSVHTLQRGQRVDVFGSYFGRYLAPEGTPYGARAIPPESLNSTRNPARCNYLLFAVRRAFPVYSGPIARGLGQPGLGLQYVLDSAVFPGDVPRESLNIGLLVRRGYLRALKP